MLQLNRATQEIKTTSAMVMTTLSNTEADKSKLTLENITVVFSATVLWGNIPVHSKNLNNVSNFLQANFSCKTQVICYIT